MQQGAFSGRAVAVDAFVWEHRGRLCVRISAEGDSIWICVMRGNDMLFVSIIFCQLHLFEHGCGEG